MLSLNIDQYIQIVTSVATMLAACAATYGACIARKNSRDAWAIVTRKREHVCEVKCRTGLIAKYGPNRYGDCVLAEPQSDTYKNQINSYSNMVDFIMVYVNNIGEIPIIIEQIGFCCGGKILQFDDSKGLNSCVLGRVDVGGSLIFSCSFEDIFFSDNMPIISKINFIKDAMSNKNNLMLFAKTTFGNIFTCDVPEAIYIFCEKYK